MKNLECKCENKPKKLLKIRTKKETYEVEFGPVQIEITGKCNMRCLHCRAVNQLPKDMPVNQIIKVIRFARQFSPDYKEIIISGGEPLLHSQFEEVLKVVRKNGGASVTLTTNGSVFQERHLDIIRELEFKRFVLSVSIDSINQKKHDEFRGYNGAFKKAVRALETIAKVDIPNLIPSMRCTIQASQIPEMEDIVKFALEIGCKRISFSAIHPVGRAFFRKDLWMKMIEKKQFLEKIYELKVHFPEINITTNDPLKCLIRGISDIGNEKEIVFDGCVAAAVSFNVNVDGTMTPCALLDVPMMNVFPLSIREITERYRNNQIVKKMLDMDLKGKCGKCSLKYQCGGCRARALVQNGDLFGDDPHCWIKF